MSLKRQDFTDILTFTRNSEKTYFGKDPDGFGGFNYPLKTAAVNEPAFDHDPVTGEALGVSIHEQRTNLLLWSEAFDNAYWTKSSLTVSANAVAAPDGLLTADNLTTDGVNSGHFRATEAITPGETYVVSIFIEKTIADAFHALYANRIGGTRETSTVQVNSKDGSFQDISAIFASVAVAPSKIEVQDVGSWWRLYFVFADAGSNTSVECTLFPNRGTALGDIDLVAGTIAVWGAQLEQGSFPTSYIPTTTAQVTRKADVCTIDNIDQSDWWNPNEGTFIVEFENNRTTPEARILYLSATTGGNYSNLIGIKRTASGNLLLEVRIGNTESARIQIDVMPEGKNIIAFKFNLVSCAISLNGGSVSSLALSAVLPTGLEILYFGAHKDGNLPLNSEFKAMKYAPKDVSDVELQELSKL